ncbi:hypothetical protein F4780DRAFT_219969 [Xylariomycetidae sp. FL0641]|nr:hypothetical protein F4780DRAFT_219969 [Xylariomycetidae sp. FL0641]
MASNTSSIPATTPTPSSTEITTPTPPSTSEDSTTPPSPTPTPSISTITTQSTLSDGSTAIVTVTSFLPTDDSSSTGSAAQSSSTGAGGGLLQGDDSSSSGLHNGGKIAVAVVVPIAGVALLVLAGLFFWRKRKQRKDAEEERRKEVEDYSYNPNNDPHIPEVGSVGGMEEASSGYRGWGSTLAGSTGRKASTTMSGGAAGAAYSDATSPIRGNVSDTRSGEPLMGDSPRSAEGEILGAMGPSAADTRNGNVARGPSNASSSYSAAGRSDGSAENGVAYGGPGYYDQYGGTSPYNEGANGSQRPGEAGGQPVIRDNPARRNTRIENPSHYPQQSAGISQNF